MAHPLTRALCKPVAGQKFTVRDNEYVLRGKLGDGAASVVRRARRDGDSKDFAVKFLAPDPKYIDRAAFEDVAARFRREGQRSQLLGHESLVKVHAYEDNINGAAFVAGSPKNPFLLMEEIRGTTLESWIKRDERRRIERHGRQAFELTPEKLSIAAHIAQALEYLHQRNLVHRDVKPANMSLTRWCCLGWLWCTHVKSLGRSRNSEVGRLPSIPQHGYFDRNRPERTRNIQNYICA